MRFVKTYILHLYMDTEMPGQWCGDLRALPDRKTYPFKNETEFFCLVQRLADEEHGHVSLKNAQDEDAPGLAKRE